MKINDLNATQIEIFSKNAILTSTFFGARKFTANIFVDDKLEKIEASAKEVYAQIEAHRNEYEPDKYQNVLHSFKITERNTRHQREFSKQLNFFQKIYYTVVKSIFGITPDFTETWIDKFYADKDPFLEISGSRSRWVDDRIELARKVKEALSANFDGSLYETVFTDRLMRGGEGTGGVGIAAPESLYYRLFRDTDYIKNPKVLIISVYGDKTYSPDFNRSGRLQRDPSLPQDAMCASYVMSQKEWENLPNVNQDFIEFMDNYRKKLSSS